MKNFLSAAAHKVLRRDCDKVFVRFLLSLLIISNLFTCFAAETEQPLLPAAIDNIEHTYTVEIEGQEPFTIRTRRTNLFKLGMIRESAHLNPEERIIALRDNFSRLHFENLIAYLNIDSLEVIHHMGIANLRRSFLSHCSPDEFVGLIQTMDALLLDAEERYEIIEFALKKLNFKNFKQLADNHLLQGSSETIAIVLKEMQLATLGANEMAKRDLAHPLHLGAEKVALLKENGLWNVEISIEDLYNNEATRHLLNAELSEQTQVRYLNLINRFITNLHGFHLIPHLDTINSLHLSHNELETIDATTFTAMPRLIGLFLNNNRLKTIDTTAFATMPALRILDLENNQLKTIPPTVFTVLPQLRKLDLSFNELTAIDSTIFNSTPLLEKLALHRNKLTTVDTATFTPLAALQELNLGSNQITELAPTTFFNKPELKNLYLHNNKITEIKRETFDNLPRLEILSLFNNPDKNIPVLPNFFSWKKIGIVVGISCAIWLTLDYTKTLLFEQAAFKRIPHLSLSLGGAIVTVKDVINYDLNRKKFRRLYANLPPTCEVIL